MRKINAYEPGIIKITKKETQNYEKESNRFTGTGTVSYTHLDRPSQ